MKDRRKGFCFQTTEAMDLIRATFAGSQRKAAIALYQSMSDLANRRRRDGGRDGFKASRKELADFAGMGVASVSELGREFERIGLVTVLRDQTENGLNLPNTWVLDDPPEPAESEYVGQRRTPEGDAHPVGQRRTTTSESDVLPTDLRNSKKNGKKELPSGRSPGVKANETEVDRLCSLLADRIETNSRSRPAIDSRWRTACQRLLDGAGDYHPHTPTEIERLIDGATAETVTKARVISMPALERLCVELDIRFQPWLDPDTGEVDQVRDGLAFQPRGRRGSGTPPARASELVDCPAAAEDLAHRWKVLDASLRAAVDASTYELNLAGLHPHALDEDGWTIGVSPDRFGWLEMRFGRLLNTCAGGQPVRLVACTGEKEETHEAA